LFITTCIEKQCAWPLIFTFQKQNPMLIDYFSKDVLDGKSLYEDYTLKSALKSENTRG